MKVSHETVQTAKLNWHGPIHYLPPGPNQGRHSVQPMQHGFQYEDELMRVWRLIFEVEELHDNLFNEQGIRRTE